MGGNVPLYAIDVIADSPGDIGLGRLVFNVTSIPNVQLSNFILLTASGMPVGGGYVDEDSIVATDEYYSVDIIVEFSYDGPFTVSAGNIESFIFIADVVKGTSSSYPDINMAIRAKELVWTDYTESGPLGRSDPNVWNRDQWYDSFLVSEVSGGFFEGNNDTVHFTE